MYCTRTCTVHVLYDLRQAKEWWVALREHAAGNLSFLSERDPGQSANAPKVALSTWADVFEVMCAWPTNAHAANAPEDELRAACFLLEASHMLLFEASGTARVREAATPAGETSYAA